MSGLNRDPSEIQAPVDRESDEGIMSRMATWADDVGDLSFDFVCTPQITMKGVLVLEQAPTEDSHHVVFSYRR
jgi:hypothetical protein